MTGLASNVSAWSADIQSSPTHSNKFLSTPLVASYNTSATIHQGAKSSADAKVLKAKRSLNWTDPFKRLAVGPSPSDSTPNGRTLTTKLLNSDLPRTGRTLTPTVELGSPVQILHQSARHRRPSTIPTSWANAISGTTLSTPPPPLYVTEDDVSVPVECLEADKISSHRLFRCRGGVIAVLYETHWKVLPHLSWERESDLLHSRQHILHFRTSAPRQLRQTKWCTDACASVLLNANLPATRAPVFCLPATATSVAKVGLAGSTAPSSSSALTSGTRTKIIFGGSHTIQLTVNT